MERRHIAVSGLMGAGKSTLVRGMAREFDYLPLEERFEENPYLANFYREPTSWAFRSYVFFFQRTLEDYRRAAMASCSIQERVLQEHFWVFGQEFHARGYISDDDLDLLGALTDTSVAVVQEPDLLIYLEIAPEEAQLRLRQRSSEAEGEIPLDYLRSLNDRYDQLIGSWGGRVLRLDSSSRDFREAGEIAALAEEIDDSVRSPLG